MARGRESFEKRQREKDRRDRSLAKVERRRVRRDSEPTDADRDEQDDTALMARYGRLAARHAVGELAEGEFLSQKREIFASLGLELD